MRIFSSLNKRFGRAKVFAVTAVLLATITGGLVYSFGPERPTYDWNNPADRGGSFVGPVFNSFINTPTYGDERNLSRIAPVTAGQNPWDANYSEEVNATGGQEYWIRTFVHNNANQDTNCLPVHKAADGTCTQVDADAPGVAHNTKVKIAIADGTSNGVGVMSSVSADNAKNKDGQPLTTVWDSSTLVNNNDRFNVSYVPGSALIVNNAHPNGVALPDDIAGANGTAIGFDQMNGNLPGCFEFSAYVFVKVKVAAPKLQITKQVRTPGTTEWKDIVDAKPGDTVQWLVHVTNIGTSVQNNVVASDLLPPHLTYVDGSAKWYSKSQNGVAYDFNQFIINKGNGGYIFGNYAPQGDFLVRFDTKVAGDFNECSLVVRNVAQTKSEQQTNELMDTAEVKITRENCQPVTPTTPTTPSTLPNTGAGDILGIFAAVSIAGTAAHRFIWTRRFSR